MNDIPGIKTYDFMNPTGNPWVNANDLRDTIVKKLAASQTLASSNRAGAKLRVGRAANEHLAILADIMEGQPVRVDLTQGDSLSVHFGGRRIHLPTFNERTLTVVQAGVRYAPVQHAIWDEGTHSTRLIGAQESLTHTLRGLVQNGIKDLPIAEQASQIAGALENFRSSSLLHLRFGPQAVGGALPYYLSHQISIGPQHPATRAAMQVESLVGQALRSMKSNVVTGKLGQDALQESYSYVRQALAHQLAIGLMLFEDGSKIKSTGVKTFQLRGIDSFGGSRDIGATGRLMGSDLPAWGYGVATPGEALAKGLHHRRALMALPRATVDAIREQGSRLRGIKSPMRSSRLLMSSYDIAAQTAATQQYGQMGVKLEGQVAQLETSVKGMFLRPKAGLSAGDQGLAQFAQTALFGDSTILASSPEMTGIAGEYSRFHTTRTTQLANARGGIGYATADLNPVLRDAVEKAGVGGPTTLASPITFEMLGGKAEAKVGRGGRMYQRVMEKARIGGALTSTGEVKTTKSGKALGQYLQPNEVITGFRSGPGGTQAVISRVGDVSMQEGTPALLGRKRVSFGGVIKGFRGVDVVGPAGGKLGFELASPDALVDHVAYLVERKGGRKGLHDVAHALGGKLKRGLNQIDVGDAELFPAGTDGRLNLQKMRNVIETAEKHGIILGPKSETERKALLEDIYGGNVSRISELWRGQDISQHEAALRERASPQLLAAMGNRKFSDLLEGVKARTQIGLRAGQPSRGQFGRVAVRMRDLRMYAVGTAATGGADVMSMYRSNNVLKQGFGLSGPEAEQVSHSMRHYGRMWRQTVERPMALENYIEGLSAAAEGRVGRLGSGEFEIIPLEEYRKRYGAGLNKVPRRSELKDLRGTPFVEEVDGALRPTRKTLVVEMPAEGAMSLSRKMGANAVRTSHVVVPSGEALGLRAGEYVNFSKLEKRGLKSSFGRLAVRLHGVLTGGEVSQAYKVGGAAALTGAEHYFGRGGLRHRGPGFGVKASFSGTLVADSTLAVGEVGVSRKTAREMLRRQGWKGSDLTAKLRSIESGETDYFTHFKTEPMRAPEHLTQARVKVLPTEMKIGGKGGMMASRADHAIHVNPLGLLMRERDFDYDPGYLFNLGHKISNGQLRDFHREQTALKVMWEKNREEHKAIAQVAQQIVASTNSKGAAERLQSRSAEMIADARKIAAQFMGREVHEGAHTVEHALAQTMAATPELLTPLMNVRHRTRIQILEDVAMGRDIDSMVMKNQASESKEALRAAMSGLRSDMPAVAWLHTAAKASEYTVLKKAHAEQALSGIEHMSKAPDAYFAALAADLRIGSARPGTKEAETEVGHLMSPLMDLMKLGEGGSHEVAGALHGGTDAVARRMAVSYQAASYLERQGVMSSWESFLTDPSHSGTAIRGPGGFVAQYMKHLEGRDPEFAGRLLSGGHNWGGIDAGLAEGARAAGDAAIIGSKGAISSFAKNFVTEGGKALRGLWDSKWGKWGAGGIAVMAAISAGRSLFGSGGGDTTPPGAPMPPPPMLGGVGPERELDYTGIPNNSEARIQRVPQVRTHYQVTGRTGSRMDFRGLGGSALGAFGRKPVHTGTFIDETSRQSTRNKIENEVNDRMYADF